MLYKLKIKFFKSDNFKYSVNIGSVMHGVLMDIVSESFAEKMHVSAYRPFSQNTEFVNGQLIWTVNLLNDEAYENIAKVILSESFNEIYIKDRDAFLQIESKEIISISYDDLLKKHYMYESPSRYVNIMFTSPTAFKSNGKYVIFPTSQLIFDGLIRRYDFSSDKTELTDDKLYELIEKNTSIVEYKLKSVKFMLEGVKIPAFIGQITIKIGGANEFERLMNMLLEYGEYSGVGIKTAMGMGSIKTTRKRGMFNGQQKG